MSILKRLITNYEALQHGKSWIEYNAENVLNAISAQHALAKGYGRGQHHLATGKPPGLLADAGGQPATL